MYGLPPEFEASVFVGSTLVAVELRENTVGLAFDSGIVITVSTGFDYTDAQRRVLRQDFNKPAYVNTLLGKTITGSEANTDGTLTLHFGEETVTLRDDSRQYESYTILLGDHEIYV
jgi:hypothetical protein